MTVTEPRTMRDCAHQMRGRVDERDPEAEVIRGVRDTLNTHPPAARDGEFPYTPKRGSRLNMAEIAFRVLSRQCRGRRIPDAAPLKRQVAAYEARRNAA